MVAHDLILPVWRPNYPTLAMPGWGTQTAVRDPEP